MFSLSLSKRSKLVPELTGCKATMHGQTCLCVSEGTVTSHKFKCIDTVFYSLSTHL